MRRMSFGLLGMLLLAGSLVAYQVRGVEGASLYADPLFQQQWPQGEALPPNF